MFTIEVFSGTASIGTTDELLSFSALKFAWTLVVVCTEKFRRATFILMTVALLLLLAKGLLICDRLPESSVTLPGFVMKALVPETSVISAPV